MKNALKIGALALALGTVGCEYLEQEPVQESSEVQKKKLSDGTYKFEINGHEVTYKVDFVFCRLRLTDQDTDIYDVGVRCNETPVADGLSYQTGLSYYPRERLDRRELEKYGLEDRSDKLLRRAHDLASPDNMVRIDDKEVIDDALKPHEIDRKKTVNNILRPYEKCECSLE